MFCWKCGKELSETARFCSNCGTPVRKIEQSNDDQPTAAPENQSHITEDTITGTQVTAPVEVSSGTQTAASEEVSPGTQTAASEEVSSGTQITSSEEIPPAAPVQNLVVRKKRITVTGDRLLVDGTYYRKTKRRFKKKKGQLGVPLSLVKAATISHTPCTGRIIASLLLFLIFTAGTVLSGFIGWQSWERLNTPYRQEQTEKLEQDLNQLDGSSETQLDELDAQLEEAADKYAHLESQLEEYKAKRQQEIMRTVLADPSFDTQTLFSTDFFADAYQQYLEDLLDAFLKDQAIHDWLYPYYAYSIELGKNNYIQDEMYFYALSEDDNIFSDETEDPKVLLQNTYNYDLHQHIYYTGRIYITASDFMNRVLHVPDYAVNGAVFMKAYGGTPDPTAMHVPGWTNADYTGFWQDAPAYLDSPEPFWLSYGISAEEFNLDWSELADEQAFYDAYLSFMNTVAPGLGVFDMVTYSAGDDSYGGMYYDITGKEASVTEIVTLYIEEHPEYLEEHIPDLEELPSSCDQQIAAAQNDMDELAARINDMTNQRNELAAFLNSGDSLRAEYDQLLMEVQEYRNLLIHNLILFGGIFILLLLMALICLIMFIRLVKKPKHLMILTLEDGTEAAFSIKFCSRKNLAALQERLPTQPTGPHT